jgi:hypothetical protein
MRTKQSTLSVFRTLLDAQKPFAVTISDVFLKASGQQRGYKEYYIICKKGQKLTSSFLVSLGLEFNDKHGVFEHEMNENEINEFVENKDDFVNVLKNEFGRVYELKGKEFNKFYNV